MKNEYWRVDYKDLAEQIRVRGFGIYPFSYIKRVVEQTGESKPLSNYIKFCKKKYVPNWKLVSEEVSRITNKEYDYSYCKKVYLGKQRSDKIKLIIENILKGSKNEKSEN